MSEAVADAPAFTLARAARVAGFAAGLTLYAALASAATIIYPPLGIAFLAPVAVAIVAVAPRVKASPSGLAMALLLLAAFLFPIWPVYLFLKLGPLPILTPPRLALYAVSALWAYDMTFSPHRRGQFLHAVKKSGAVSAIVFLLFLLGLLSLPLAQGKSIAVPEFFRQTIIWLVPYCAVLTYCRRQRDFIRLMQAMTLGAFIVAIIAISEAASRRLLADLLSPFIADNAEWLQNVQTAKVRDGIFRAQATHSHPLSLGEHLAFAAPFAVAFFLRARLIGGCIFWGAAFAAIAFGAVASNSRGAMLVMAISIAAMTALLAYRFLKRAAASRWRPLAGLIVLACVVVSPVAAVGAHWIVSGKAGQSAANSTQSRVDQIEMAWPKIKARPVLGYGSGRSARIVGYWGRTLTLDNYYLTLALDLGLPGPLAFAAMLFAWGSASLKRSRCAHPSLGVVYVACFAAAVSIFISRSIASQTGNLTLIYMMLAAFAGASVTFSRRRGRNRA